jgi:hypothetical protein
MTDLERHIARAYWSGWLIGILGFALGTIVGWRL